MGINNRVDLLEVFGDKEKEIVMKVLEKYQVNRIVDIKKIKGAYKVVTDNSTLCLKKIKHGFKRIRNTIDFVDELSKIGFNNAPQYLKTSDKNVFVKYKNMIFFAVEWIDGNECNLENIYEAQKCMQLVARFHLVSNKIDSKHLRIKNNIRNWPQVFNNNLRELERFKKIIENKRLKNEFDLAYFKFIDNYIYRGTLALKIFNDSNYYHLSKVAFDEKTICQDSCFYESVSKRNEKHYIIDLNSVVIDLRINDVAKIIRKLMYKNEYQWDFSKAKLLLEAYNFENKFSKEEVGAMLALIIFPHKFWKLGKKRYIKYKNWNEVRYMHKLNRLIKYNELQEKFIEEYLKYVLNYV